MQYTPAEFVNIIYVNIWLVLLIIAAVLAMVIFIIRRAKNSSGGSANAKAHRKSKRSRTRYYDRSDSVDLRNQYIKSGSRDRGSVHDLDEIGIARRRKKNTGKGF